MVKRPGSPAFWTLAAAEPFRLFFPLATLVGISGVSLWPLFFSGLHKFYPGIMHARMMAEGFLGGFVIGFLATALPRLLEARPLSRAELSPLALLFLLCTGLHIGHQTRSGDAAFVGMFACLLVAVARRWRRGVDLPPPSFVLVAFGLGSALAGPLLTLGASSGLIGGRSFFLGSLLLHQGFALFLILGVGAFLLPRFLGVGGFDPRAEERSLTPVWRRRAGWAALTGAALAASYWLEAGDPLARTAPLLRATVAAAFLLGAIPFRSQTQTRSTVAWAAQLGLVALIAGLAFPLAWPAQRLAGLHVVFIGGFSVIVFALATRVVLGHAGKGERTAAPLPSLRLALGLLTAGALFRALGDFLPIRAHWLNGASCLWMLAALVWGWAILREVRTADPAGEASGDGSSPTRA